jgi:hypothetical protein
MAIVFKVGMYISTFFYVMGINMLFAQCEVGLVGETDILNMNIFCI